MSEKEHDRHGAAGPDKEKGVGTDKVPDPITGAPGSHPVGTGVGAAAGGAAGIGAAMAAGAVTGAAVGPVGSAVGAAVGAVAGGLAGHALAGFFDPFSNSGSGKSVGSGSSKSDPISFDLPGEQHSLTFKIDPGNASEAVVDELINAMTALYVALEGRRPKSVSIRSGGER